MVTGLENTFGVTGIVFLLILVALTGPFYFIIVKAFNKKYLGRIKLLFSVGWPITSFEYTLTYSMCIIWPQDWKINFSKKYAYFNFKTHATNLQKYCAYIYVSVLALMLFFLGVAALTHLIKWLFN